MAETGNPNVLDRSIRCVVGVTAVLFGILLVVRKSGKPDLLDRYTVEYAALLLAYVPLLVSASLFMARGGRVVAIIRPVFSLRPFQLGLALFLLIPALLIVRYVRHGSGIDVIRITAVSFFLSAYLLYGLRIAGRRGIDGLQSSVTNLTLLGGTIVVLSLVTTAYFSLRGTTDLVTIDDVQPKYELSQKSNAEFVYHGQVGRIREFSIRIRNNSFGFNDRERTVENREGRFRILVLGDSYVEALQVPQGKSFTAHLEKLLNEDEDRFEVIPLGRSGAGQKEELKLLEELGLRFKPDLVILLFVNNDLYDNEPQLEEDYRDYVRKWSPTPPSPRVLFFPSLLVDRLLTARLHTLVARYGYIIDQRLRTQTVPPQFLAFISPPPPQIQRAMSITEALLDRIVEKCSAYDARFFLVEQPLVLTRESFLRNYPGLRDLHIDMTNISRWLQAYAASRSVYYLNPKPYFLAHLEAGGETISWKHDRHWNEVGHRLAAEAIHKYLAANDLLN